MAKYYINMTSGSIVTLIEPKVVTVDNKQISGYLVEKADGEQIFAAAYNLVPISSQPSKQPYKLHKPIPRD